MKTNNRLRKSAIVTKYFAIFALGLMLMPVLANAVQLESPVNCNEGAEPVDMAYGDHTVDCAVNPATDL